MRICVTHLLQASLLGMSSLQESEESELRVRIQNQNPESESGIGIWKASDKSPTSPTLVRQDPKRSDKIRKDPGRSQKIRPSRRRSLPSPTNDRGRVRRRPTTPDKASWTLGKSLSLWTFIMAEVKEGGWRALQESGDVGGGVSAFVINVQ